MVWFIVPVGDRSASLTVEVQLNRARKQADKLRV